MSDEDVQSASDGPVKARARIISRPSWITRSWRRLAGSTVKRWHVKLSDDFHRLKRTTLLYLSGCLLLSIANGTAPVTVPGFAIALDHVALWWLIAAGAAYYLWGFVHQVRMALAENGELASQDTADSVSVAAKRLAGFFVQTKLTIEDMLPRVDTFLDLQKWLDERMPDDIDVRQVLIPNLGGHSADDLNGHALHAIEMANRGIRAHVDEYVDKISARLEVLAGDWQMEARSVRTITSRLDDNLALLVRTAATVTALDEGIHYSSRRHFVLWEVGAVAGLAAIVLAAGAPEIVAGAARTTKTAIIVRQHVEDIGCASANGLPACHRAAQPREVERSS